MRKLRLILALITAGIALALAAAGLYAHQNGRVVDHQALAVELARCNGLAQKSGAAVAGCKANANAFFKNSGNFVEKSGPLGRSTAIWWWFGGAAALVLGLIATTLGTRTGPVAARTDNGGAGS